LNDGSARVDVNDRPFLAAQSVPQPPRSGEIPARAAPSNRPNRCPGRLQFFGNRAAVAQEPRMDAVPLAIKSLRQAEHDPGEAPRSGLG